MSVVNNNRTMAATEDGGAITGAVSGGATLGDGGFGLKASSVKVTPRKVVPPLSVVHKTSPRKYGDLPGKLRVIRRSALMDKDIDETIRGNPYEIAQGLQWQGFAGSYRTNKNYDNTNEKKFFITYDLGPLAVAKKKPVLQTI